MKIPVATYRLQLNHQFGFQDVRLILEYLQKLGITDIYASPVFCAEPKSMHGYDMAVPTRINPELGTEDEFRKLLCDVRSRGMGWVQDFVPNHMAFSHHNPWLMDVLEFGPASMYYHFFDIRWDHPDPDLHGKVLAPFLGESLEHVINNGQLKLNYDRDGFSVCYYEHRFPVSPLSITDVIQNTQLHILAPYLSLFNTRSTDCQVSQQEKIKLYEAYQKKAEVRTALHTFIKSINSNTELFRQLMAKQYYHLAHWKTAQEKINYRRFFYINDLICLNIERPEVFDAVHSGLEQWIQNKMITGLRIDHLDGLKYPEHYLYDLRQRFGDLYVVAEKILEKDEALPPFWPLQGTTGYDFANSTTAIFCDHQNQNMFNQQYAELIGAEHVYEQLLFEQKTKVITEHMRGDIDNLVDLLRLTENFRDREIHSSDLAEALTHLIAAFGIYRTYKTDHAPGHREYLSTAVTQAKKYIPERSQILDEIQTIFLTASKSQNDETFVARFRQLTGPAMAKGFEDTLLYIYYPLVSLNDVGSMPEVFGISLQQFHKFNQARLQTPHTLNATSTHDTKRGEDVRARINVLSEMPQQWFEKVRFWNRLNQPYKTYVDDAPAPDANDEYMLYQVMLGALPVDPNEHDLFCDRLKKYLIKCVREAKIHSNWIQSNERYEKAFIVFFEKLFENSQHNAFWEDFLVFWRQIHEFGVITSCAQTLLKMTCPGVPDFYQGTEAWDLNLVDPDNRRPVDYTMHMHLLNQLIEEITKGKSDFCDWLHRQRNTGQMKLFIIRKALHLRQKLPALFTDGDYIPLRTEGRHKDRLIAFARVNQDNHMLVIVPRLIAGLVAPGQFPIGAVWDDTRLHVPQYCQGQAIDIFTEKQINLQNEKEIAEILEKFPLSLICDSDKLCHNDLLSH